MAKPITIGITDTPTAQAIRALDKKLDDAVSELQGNVTVISNDLDATLPINESDVTNLVADLASKSPIGHTHPESDVTGLVADLAGKAPLVHAHDIDDVTGLQAALDGKSDVGHTHPESDITGLIADLAGKAPLSHTHPESDVTNLITDLAGKQPLDATLTALAALDATAGLLEETALDTFTKRAIGVGASTSIPTRADADGRYAAISHTHPESDITGLVSDLASKVPTTRTISTTAPLAGGGDLSANRTLSINADGIDDTLLRNSAALSVIGRSANSSGDPADITAAANGSVLQRLADTVFFDTRLTLNGSSNLDTINAYNTDTAQTASVACVSVTNTGTYNCTAGALSAYAYYGDANVSRSAGANALTAIGGRFRARGGQVNQAIRTEEGDVLLNNVSGGTTIKGATAVQNTLSVTNLATLTGGFTLGAASSAGSFKITSLANGTVSTDAAAFGQIGTAVNAAVSGTANTIAKFSGTNVVGNSLLTDNATTLSYNAGKFTVTAANGNTTVAGTLGVTGVSTLTGGFTLGAASSAGSFKITSLANGTVSTDAAAFGQIGTAVSAAVSGTSGRSARFTATNVVGTGAFTDDGTNVSLAGTMAVSVSAANKASVASIAYSGTYTSYGTPHILADLDDTINSGAYDLGTPVTSDFYALRVRNRLNLAGSDASTFGNTVNVFGAHITAAPTRGSFGDSASEDINLYGLRLGADLSNIDGEASSGVRNAYSLYVEDPTGTATNGLKYSIYADGQARFNNVSVVGTLAAALPAASVTGLAAIATSGSASDLTAGTVPAARMPAHTGDVTTVAGAVATTIAANAVTDTKLRDSAALSVIGRSANTTGDPADIAAGTDGHVLRRSGTTLGFGTIAAVAMPAFTGDVTTVAGAVATTIANNAVTDAKLRDSTAASVIGRSAATLGDPADIVSTADGEVLRRSGTTIGWGAIPESSVTNLVSDLAAKAPLASPTFTGTVTAAAVNATGNVTAGDASTDTHTVNGNVTFSNTPAAGPIKYGSLNARLRIGQQIFTASGTYTPSTGTKAVRVRMVGGGGGGGGAGGGGNRAVGSGGGSGCYWEKFIDPATTVTGGAVTIGAAGTAGVNTGLSPGGSGGDTSVVIQTLTYTAKGGTGGSGSASGTAAAPTPGACASGSTAGWDVFAGQPGSMGVNINSVALQWGGAGGSNPLGCGGEGYPSLGAGAAGRGYGAGGAGANATVAGQLGGAGTAGVVIIEEYA